jgi:hypothetical protein
MARSVGRLVVSVGLMLALLCVAAVRTAWAAPPPNDTFENATLIAAPPFIDTVDTTEATTGPEDAARATSCGISTPSAKSVWYRYTPSGDQEVVIDTAGSSFAAGGSVGTADSCVVTFLASGRFLAQAGQTYWIALADVGGGAGGLLQLSVNFLPETIVAGRARLSGPSGCVYAPFTATVRGRRIALVRFYLDGRRVRRIADRRRVYRVKVNPRGLGIGPHRITVRVRFVAGSRTPARTLRLTFRRCAPQTVPCASAAKAAAARLSRWSAKASDEAVGLSSRTAASRQRRDSWWIGLDRCSVWEAIVRRPAAFGLRVRVTPILGSLTSPTRGHA